MIIFYVCWLNFEFTFLATLSQNDQIVLKSSD